MTINVDNDFVQLYTNHAGEYSWRRRDSSNGQVVLTPGESYQSAAYAREAAEAYNPGLVVVQVLDEREVPGERRLGRHVEHDPRSWAYQADRIPVLRSIQHKRHVAPFDQGQLGSCTGNAMAGLLMTDPYFRPGRHFTEKTAVKFYEYATAHDSVKGAYPPDDTGSSGLAVAKAARADGYITGYRHAFGLQHALEALVVAPVIIGVNWYDGFDNPGPDGFVRISGRPRGGHEFELVGIDVETSTVRACNSWGSGWGDQGYFTFSWSDLDRLLREQGDVTAVTA